ncbi:hypothetical protein P7L87_27175, partial [Vibrio parahaemolyticus]|nr:hypothetical protein [Vibrio parahaemolyticus]
LIRCTSKTGPEIVLALGSEKRLGRRVSCLHSEFVADMEPCAPEGKFGLSRPTGAADLVKIVDRWQEYSDHLGGVTSHYVTPKEIAFSGGFHGSTNGYQQFWRFTANRLVGTGTLKIEKGQYMEGDYAYQCQKASQKF